MSSISALLSSYSASGYIDPRSRLYARQATDAAAQGAGAAAVQQLLGGTSIANGVVAPQPEQGTQIRGRGRPQQGQVANDSGTTEIDGSFRIHGGQPAPATLADVHSNPTVALSSSAFLTLFAAVNNATPLSPEVAARQPFQRASEALSQSYGLGDGLAIDIAA